MKVAVTGKGGVGKTTVAAHLARCWRSWGGAWWPWTRTPTPTSPARSATAGPRSPRWSGSRPSSNERVGGGDGWGGFLRMNPRVDDIPAQIGVDIDGIRLLVMGTIERGRRGCACPENILLREVLKHLMLGQDEDVVVDMEAGIEHLGRRTAEGVDVMLVVVEPGWASIETASASPRWRADLGLTRVVACRQQDGGGPTTKRSSGRASGICRSSACCLRTRGSSGRRARESGCTTDRSTRR